MQVSLECGLIQRELPQGVIISLRGRHVNGRRPLLPEGLPGTAHPAATVVPLHICDTPMHGLALTQPPVQILPVGRLFSKSDNACVEVEFLQTLGFLLTQSLTGTA